ncbi:putative involucrin repeat protein [Phaeomoniella chlamydospora]|uniref:Putative involucrin repeat protein n=1 Tax=Phaeomoniella chlamydospora TaxID=158046 RepID=A0A0G2ESS5_PHACM|nr:putative involucrin repeat protein [Phaeomoniella chlamydospora]
MAATGAVGAGLANEYYSAHGSTGIQYQDSVYETAPQGFAGGVYGHNSGGGSYSKPPKMSSNSNEPLYGAAAAAAGAAAGAFYTDHHGQHRSSPRDAPRRHHYKRRSGGSRYGSTTRVDKLSRYPSSDEERRKKSKNGTSWLAAGAAGYGLAKVGQALFNNKGFDDTYSVKSGRPMQPDEDSYREGDRTSRVEVREDFDRQRSTQRKDSKRNYGLRSEDISAAEAALAGGATAIGMEKRRRRSRSRSPKQKRRDKADPALGSYVDLSQTQGENAGIGSFFVSPSLNRTKSGKRKNKGFFTFSNSSSSSSDADLAFGSGYVRRKNSKRSKDRRDKDDHAAILALGATAAGLAAAGAYEHRKDRKHKDVYAVKETRDKHRRRRSDRASRETAQDDGWEDASDDGDADSVDSGLIYGVTRRGSRSSLSSNGSGTDKWAWRWNNKIDKRAKGKSSAADIATAVGTAAAISSVGGRGSHADSVTSSRPLQEVYPIPTSDPNLFDTVRNGSVDSPVVARPGIIPIQQPQPIAPVNQQVYATQFTGSSVDAFNSKYPPLPDHVLARESFTESPTQIGQRKTRRSEDDTPVESKSRSKKEHRRRDTSPAALSSRDMIEGSAISSRSATRDRPTSVTFDLPEPRSSKEDAEYREERRRRKEERRVRRKSDPNSRGSEESVSLEDQSAIEKLSRSDEIDHELQRLYEEQRQAEASKKSSSSWVAPVVAGAAAAAAGVVIAAETRNSHSDDETVEIKPRESRKEKKTRETRQEDICAESVDDTKPERSESLQRRLARMAAERVKSSPSPLYEDYSNFFAPEELKQHLKEHNEASQSRQGSVPPPDDVPEVVEIAPVAAKFAFPDELYHPFGLDPNDDPTLFPWIIPQLRLQDPTPVHSAAASVRGELSPVIQAQEPEFEEPEIVRHDDVKQDEPVNKPGSRVSWGEHSFHEYEVAASEEERDHVTGPHADRGYSSPPSDASETTRERRRRRKQREAMADIVDVEPETPRETKPTRTPSPVSGSGINGMPGGFGTDLDFAASLAAGAEAAGFDPSIVIDDPSFHRRDSPPGSDVRPATGFVEGEIAETPVEEVGEFDKMGKIDEYQSASEYAERPTVINESSREMPARFVDALDEEAVSVPLPPSEVGTSSRVSDSWREDNYYDNAAANSPEASEDGSRRRRSRKKSSRSSDVFDGASQVSESVVGDEPSSGKKSKRKSKRASEIFDDDDDDAVSVAASAPGYDETSGNRKSRRKSKRDSEVFDDDAASVVSSPVTRREEAESKRKSKDKKAGGLFGGLFGVVKAAQDASADKEKERDDKSVRSESRIGDYDDFEEPTRRRKKKSRDKGFDDVVSEAMSKSHNLEKEVNENGEPLKAERPDMPAGLEGVSGPETPFSPITKSNDSLAAAHTPSRLTRSRSVSPSRSPKVSLDPETPGWKDSDDRTAQMRQRRLSEIRTQNFGSSPTSISPTAVPLHFRRPPLSPRHSRSGSSNTNELESPQPSMPLSLPRTRKDRPKSMEFKSSKEFRPLYLLERHTSSKVEPEPEENYPPLPSSQGSSANSSVEDLTAVNREGEYSNLPRAHPTWSDHEQAEAYWAKARAASPDYLDSQQATPKATDFPLSAKKEKLKYEFHSPSELLQDPAFYEGGDQEESRSVSPMLLPHSESTDSLTRLQTDIEHGDAKREVGSVDIPSDIPASADDSHPSQVSEELSKSHSSLSEVGLGATEGAAAALVASALLNKETESIPKGQPTESVAENYKAIPAETTTHAEEQPVLEQVQQPLESKDKDLKPSELHLEALEPASDEVGETQGAQVDEEWALPARKLSKKEKRKKAKKALYLSEEDTPTDSASREELVSEQPSVSEPSHELDTLQEVVSEQDQEPQRAVQVETAEPTMTDEHDRRHTMIDDAFEKAKDARGLAETSVRGTVDQASLAEPTTEATEATADDLWETPSISKKEKKGKKGKKNKQAFLDWTDEPTPKAEPAALVSATCESRNEPESAAVASEEPMITKATSASQGPEIAGHPGPEQGHVPIDTVEVDAPPATVISATEVAEMKDLPAEAPVVESNTEDLWELPTSTKKTKGKKSKRASQALDEPESFTATEASLESKTGQGQEVSASVETADMAAEEGTPDIAVKPEEAPNEELIPERARTVEDYEKLELPGKDIEKTTEETVSAVETPLETPVDFFTPAEEQPHEFSWEPTSKKKKKGKNKAFSSASASEVTTPTLETPMESAQEDADAFPWSATPKGKEDDKEKTKASVAAFEDSTTALEPVPETPLETPIETAKEEINEISWAPTSKKSKKDKKKKNCRPQMEDTEPPTPDIESVLETPAEMPAAVTDELECEPSTKKSKKDKKKKNAVDLPEVVDGQGVPSEDSQTTAPGSVTETPLETAREEIPEFEFPSTTESKELPEQYEILPEQTPPQRELIGIEEATAVPKTIAHTQEEAEFSWAAIGKKSKKEKKKKRKSTFDDNEITSEPVASLTADEGGQPPVESVSGEPALEPTGIAKEDPLTTQEALLTATAEEASQKESENTHKEQTQRELSVDPRLQPELSEQPLEPVHEATTTLPMAAETEAALDEPRDLGETARTLNRLDQPQQMPIEEPESFEWPMSTKKGKKKKKKRSSAIDVLDASEVPVSEAEEPVEEEQQTKPVNVREQPSADLPSLTAEWSQDESVPSTKALDTSTNRAMDEVTSSRETKEVPISEMPETIEKQPAENVKEQTQPEDDFWSLPARKGKKGKKAKRASIFVSEEVSSPSTEASPDTPAGDSTPAEQPTEFTWNEPVKKGKKGKKNKTKPTALESSDARQPAGETKELAELEETEKATIATDGIPTGLQESPEQTISPFPDGQDTADDAPSLATPIQAEESTQSEAATLFDTPPKDSLDQTEAVIDDVANKPEEDDEWALPSKKSKKGKKAKSSTKGELSDTSASATPQVIETLIEEVFETPKEQPEEFPWSVPGKKSKKDKKKKKRAFDDWEQEAEKSMPAEAEIVPTPEAGQLQSETVLADTDLEVQDNVLETPALEIQPAEAGPEATVEDEWSMPVKSKSKKDKKKKKKQMTSDFDEPPASSTPAVGEDTLATTETTGLLTEEPVSSLVDDIEHSAGSLETAETQGKTQNFEEQAAVVEPIAEPSSSVTHEQDIIPAKQDMGTEEAVSIPTEQVMTAEEHEHVMEEQPSSVKLDEEASSVPLEDPPVSIEEATAEEHLQFPAGPATHFEDHKKNEGQQASFEFHETAVEPSSLADITNPITSTPVLKGNANNEVDDWAAPTRSKSKKDKKKEKQMSFDLEGESPVQSSEQIQPPVDHDSLVKDQSPTQMSIPKVAETTISLSEESAPAQDAQEQNVEEEWGLPVQSKSKKNKKKKKQQVFDFNDEPSPSTITAGEGTYDLSERDLTDTGLTTIPTEHQPPVDTGLPQAGDISVVPEVEDEWAIPSKKSKKGKKKQQSPFDFAEESSTSTPAGIETPFANVSEAEVIRSGEVDQSMALDAEPIIAGTENATPMETSHQTLSETKQVPEIDTEQQATASETSREMQQDFPAESVKLDPENLLKATPVLDQTVESNAEAEDEWTLPSRSKSKKDKKKKKKLGLADLDNDSGTQGNNAPVEMDVPQDTSVQRMDDQIVSEPLQGQDDTTIEGERETVNESTEGTPTATGEVDDWASFPVKKSKKNKKAKARAAQDLFTSEPEPPVAHKPAVEESVPTETQDVPGPDEPRIEPAKAVEQPKEDDWFEQPARKASKGKKSKKKRQSFADWEEEHPQASSERSKEVEEPFSKGDFAAAAAAAAAAIEATGSLSRQHSKESNLAEPRSIESIKAIEEHPLRQQKSIFGPFDEDQGYTPAKDEDDHHLYRDSAVHMDDSPILVQGPMHDEIRDSGYVPSPIVPTGFDIHSEKHLSVERPIRPASPTSSTEDLKTPTHHTQESSHPEESMQAHIIPSGGVTRNQPEGTADYTPERINRRPSPVDSTTKDRLEHDRQRSLQEATISPPKTPLGTIVENEDQTRDLGASARLRSQPPNKLRRRTPEPVEASSSTYDPVKDKGTGHVRDMAGVYDGWGEAPGSPLSPTRPSSVRRRRSMQQIKDLEARLDQLASENRLLATAKLTAEKQLEDLHSATDRSNDSTQDALQSKEQELREKDANIERLMESLNHLQSEVARLSQVNEGLQSANHTLATQHEQRVNELRSEQELTHQRWQESHRELDNMRVQHTQLSAGMEEIVKHEIDSALAEKNAQIERLQYDLEVAKNQIRELQQQILASRNDEVLEFKDEDYFENACQNLCQHVKQWVMRFSKFSDTRMCRSITEIRDERLVDRFDNAVLDGSEIDDYLLDRVRRRDVFMSVAMNMIFEYIFSRYLFGMDREQRQKIKQLEKNLAEIGPQSAVNRWRALTLSILSKRPQFLSQRSNDTEAVVLEIYNTLAKFLPPPHHLDSQILDSLRKVMELAVDLSIEMRSQRAEYIMLPPLKPEYDTSGDLARKVYFNASLMNERSGETTSNEELEAAQAVVRMVLFPLVVKRGNDDGEGDEEIVVCPAQVLVARQDDRRKEKRRMVSGGQSVHSLAPSEMMDMGSNVI